MLWPYFLKGGVESIRIKARLLVGELFKAWYDWIDVHTKKSRQGEKRRFSTMKDQKATLSTTTTQAIWSFPSWEPTVSRVVFCKPGRWVTPSAALGSGLWAQCQRRKRPGFQETRFRKLFNLVVIFFKLNMKYFTQFCFYWARQTWVSFLCCLSWFDFCWCGT